MDKLFKYLSIDWITVADFLLTECGFDGRGWEILNHGVQNHYHGEVIAYLHMKFNRHVIHPDVTDLMENENPCLQILWGISHFSNRLSLIDLCDADDLLQLFEDIDILKLSTLLVYGLKARSHKRFLNQLISAGDEQRILSLFPTHLRYIDYRNNTNNPDSSMLHKMAFKVQESKAEYIFRNGVYDEKPYYQIINNLHNKKGSRR